MATPAVQLPAESIPFEAAPDLLRFPLTDSGNGERIAAVCGKDIRYCAEMRKWLVWDGKRWVADGARVVTQIFKQVVRLLHGQAAALPDGDDRKAIERHARESESVGAIDAAVRLAATEPGMCVSAAELDRHPFLLNCLNGIVDLRLGSLLAHDRAYLVTKLCGVTYDPAATCDRFIRFVHWAMGHAEGAELAERPFRLASFLQRAFGYSLTGDVSEKAAFVFWGPRGNNGKTTLLSTFREMLGDYSAQLLIDSLMTSSLHDAAVRADLADLRGARLVTTSEVEHGHKLSEGKLKYITAGMGHIKSCRKWENPVEFPATHKLFVDANHRPAVRGTDDAIWSRLKCVPFDVRIERDDPSFDPHLLDKLREEWPGILAWAVRGAQAWFRQGLGDTPELRRSNTEWREHDDPLRDFLSDVCGFSSGAPNSAARWVSVADLAAEYARWCGENSEKFPLGRGQFNDHMRSRGFVQSRGRRIDGRQVRSWEGISVQTAFFGASEDTKAGAEQTF